MGSKEKVLYPLPTLKEHRTRGSSEDRNICRVTKLCDEGRLDKTKIKVNSGNILFPALMKCLELGKYFSGLRRKIVAAKEEKKQMEESCNNKTNVLMDGEKELWESGDWRENIKDLNSSFSKLPPICKENKVSGNGQAFVVE